MSSILKALKKLEDEFPRKAGEKASLPQPPGVKKTMRRWEINSGRFASVLWAALIVVVLATAGWFLMYVLSPDEPPSPVAELPQAPLPSVAEQRRPVAPVIAPSPADRSLPRQKPAVRRKRRASPTATKTATLPAEPVGKESRWQQRATPPAAVRRSGTQTSTELPILKTGLELQAVSWAQNPKNRIAVINGSIVREGGSIEGYAVVRIDEDQVVVRKDLSQWRLVFDLNK